MVTIFRIFKCFLSLKGINRILNDLYLLLYRPRVLALAENLNTRPRILTPNYPIGRYQIQDPYFAGWADLDDTGCAADIIDWDNYKREGIRSSYNSMIYHLRANEDRLYTTINSPSLAGDSAFIPATPGIIIISVRLSMVMRQLAVARMHRSYVQALPSRNGIPRNGISHNGISHVGTFFSSKPLLV